MSQVKGHLVSGLRSESSESSGSGGSFLHSAGSEDKILEEEDEDELDEEEEEAESENWEDEDDDDFSDTEAVLLDLETNFKSLVDDKVTDTETFFDNEQYIMNYVPYRTMLHQNSNSNSKECCANNNNIIHNNHKQQQIAGSSSSTDMLPPMTRRSTEGKEFSHVECQTDDQLCDTATSTSTVPAAAKSPPAANAEGNARSEVNHLRSARESLVTQRKELADLIKQNANQDNSDSDSENEKKLYGFEEAVEAIDSAIDYKNETICGREFVMSNNLAPGKMEADLVSRLSSLTQLDLQRLFCKYFSKVVEFRFSTKKLENMVQNLEIQHEQVNRRVRRYQNQIRDIEDENADRIREIIRHYSKDPNSDLGEFLHYSKSAKAARKKQQDLEASLTELLVRHCYLRDGDDYDVKQVVKMLGIDPLQLKLYQMEEEDEERNGLPMKQLMALGDVNPTQGLSRRMREVFNNRKTGGGTERPATPAAVADHHQYRSSSHHHSHSHSSSRGYSSSNNSGGGGHSSSAYNKSHHRHYEAQDQNYCARGVVRQSTYPSTTSRYHTPDHRYYNGQSPEEIYLLEKRLEQRLVAQSPSNPLLPAEVRRHDKKITIIPRQRHR